MVTTIKRAITRTSMSEQRPTAIDRIVIVSGDGALHKILHRLFSTEGYAVDVIPNDFFSLIALCQRPPSAVVLDIADPDSSDCDLCRRIADLTPDLPLVILAAGSELAYKSRFLEMGSDDYLAIPFSPKTLLQRVRAAIERHSRIGLQKLLA